MAIHQIIGVAGLATSAVTLAINRAMQGRSRDIESGVFVQEQLRSYGVTDVWAPYIVDVGGGPISTPPIGSHQRGWGMRPTATAGERPHGAVDICGPQGTAVHAMRTGIVEQSGQKSGYGECVMLRHADGTTSIYCHMNDRLVERGDIVRGGTVIGRMGRTSNAGNKPSNLAQQGSRSDPRCQQFPVMGIHLHFGIHGYPKLINGQLLTRTMPHSLTIGRAFTTDTEWTYGRSPVEVLGNADLSNPEPTRRGQSFRAGPVVRVAARDIGNACPLWSANWAG